MLFAECGRLRCFLPCADHVRTMHGKGKRYTNMPSACKIAVKAAYKHIGLITAMAAVRNALPPETKGRNTDMPSADVNGQKTADTLRHSLSATVRNAGKSRGGNGHGRNE